MTGQPGNTPVIIGVGFCQQKHDDPAACDEALRLMELAVRDAAADAGAPGLCAEIESLSVCKGMWEYSNPGHWLAGQLGCQGARSVLADLGVLQLTPLLDLCNAIVAGELSLGVVTGGEAKYRALRAAITGQEIADTVQDEATPMPDVYHATPDPFATDAEAAAGIFMPVELFAVIESALRADRGTDVESHRDDVAELYAGFSRIAASNPHAWDRRAYTAAEIRDAGAGNAMLAFPYTKRHNSQWNVNQAVAILVCSTERARSLGVDESRWIYPQAAVQCRHVVCLAEQRKLHTHPGTVMAGERLYELGGIRPMDITVAELYSCFPAAVQSFGRDLKLEGVCPWSVTGSMAFAGGPFNHAALDGVARMVEVLRSGDGLPENEATADTRRGLVSNLSGIFGKQGLLLLSNAAGEKGYRFVDITDDVAAVDAPLTSVTGYEGRATIVGYTVAYNKEGPVHAFAYCDTPGGERTVAKGFGAALFERMTTQECVGCEVRIDAEGQFSF